MSATFHESMLRPFNHPCPIVPVIYLFQLRDTLRILTEIDTPRTTPSSRFQVQQVTDDLTGKISFVGDNRNE